MSTEQESKEFKVNKDQEQKVILTKRKDRNPSVSVEGSSIKREPKRDIKHQRVIGQESSQSKWKEDIIQPSYVGGTKALSDSEKSEKKRIVQHGNRIYATGRRKTSIARVWLAPGTGKVTINKRDMQSYFLRAFHQALVLQPLVSTQSIGRFDIMCTVKSGGLSGQAGAIRLGIARALYSYDNNMHSTLKHSKLFTRDPRAVERKKYGKRKARRSTQFSKR